MTDLRFALRKLIKSPAFTLTAVITLGIFASAALLLASIGIYGAVAYTVEQRTGEIGVRMALGAQTRDVLRLVVNQGMKPVVIGLAVGILSAFVLGRLIASQLYQVSAHNPALLAAATLLLAATALVACAPCHTCRSYRSIAN
jgi:ABC-type antimicrobial peptide transport system permease subunit